MQKKKKLAVETEYAASTEIKFPLPSSNYRQGLSLHAQSRRINIPKLSLRYETGDDIIPYQILNMSFASFFGGGGGGRISECFCVYRLCLPGQTLLVAVSHCSC